MIDGRTDGWMVCNLHQQGYRIGWQLLHQVFQLIQHQLHDLRYESPNDIVTREEHLRVLMMTVLNDIPLDTLVQMSMVFACQIAPNVSFSFVVVEVFDFAFGFGLNGNSRDAFTCFIQYSFQPY
jgi:hypothetical protein